MARSSANLSIAASLSSNSSSGSGSTGAGAGADFFSSGPSRRNLLAMEPPAVGSPNAEVVGTVSPAPPNKENDAPAASVTRSAKLNPLSTFTVFPSSLYRLASASAVNGLSAPFASSLMSPPCTKACVTSTAFSFGFTGSGSVLPRAFFIGRLGSLPSSPPPRFPRLAMVTVRVSLPVPGRWNYDAIRLRVPDKAKRGRTMRNPPGWGGREVPGLGFTFIISWRKSRLTGIGGVFHVWFSNGRRVVIPM